MTLTLTNGAIPADLLVDVAPGLQLRAGTAGRWAWVCQQVQARFGWTPTIYPGGAYRPLADQEALFTSRYTPQGLGTGPYGDVRWWRGTRYVRTSPAGAAAIPGTSNHGLGRAIDVAGLTSFSDPRRDQFAAVAVPAGFSDAEGRAVGEPWHWDDTLDPDVVTAAATTTTGGAIAPALPTVPLPAPLTTLEDDMLSLVIYCYQRLVGRDPSTDEALAVVHDQTGKTPADVVAWFLAAKPEEPAVQRAFSDYLGRTAGPPEVAAWVTVATIDALRHGVAGSPEALARR